VECSSQKKGQKPVSVLGTRICNRRRRRSFGYWRGEATRNRKSILVHFLVAMICGRGLTQENSKPLSPSEAYKAALAPFQAARAQPDDLTDADRFALQIGIARASRDCRALSSNESSVGGDEKELIALGELCLFGQEYAPARTALTKYLALPQPPERKRAMVLLVRALLGLNDQGSAELVVRSLLHDFPYDAEIHFAIDQVIDASEGLSEGFNKMAFNLCATQNAVTLPLLAGGKALEGKDATAPAGVLFNDAVRCVELAKGRDEPSGQEAMRQLAAITEMQSWQATADYSSMQASLKRQQMVDAPVPLSSLHGLTITNGKLAPRPISLRRGTVLLLPFVLWSPNASDEAGRLARLAPQQTIYAITSWSANTGRDDLPSNEILTALREWQRSLPANVHMVIVPNAELSLFHVDSFPAGIGIREGTVRWNGVLSSQGSERMLLSSLSDHK
jgi:hypothetical protein